MEIVSSKKEMDHQDTELRLGLPGTQASKIKRSFSSLSEESSSNDEKCCTTTFVPAPKAQVMGWPPIRSYRKNCIQSMKKEEEIGGMYVKVSMDGAPYLRKIDVKLYTSYLQLLNALEEMFKIKIGEYSKNEGYNGSEYTPTYEDKDGDWMLVGDVPWEMFINSCKKLRIMKGSEARGMDCSP